MSLVNDSRFALRSFAHSPGFLTSVVLTLALVLGAVTAVFGVVYRVLLEPLPYPSSDHLVMLWEEKPAKDWAFAPVTPADFLDWKAAVKTFAGLTAYSAAGLDSTLSVEGRPQIVHSLPVYGNFFSVMGVSPALGHTFSEEASASGSVPGTVLSSRSWRQLGADPSIVGRTIDLDGVGYTVLGVMPPGFDFPLRDVDLWIPIVWSNKAREMPFFRTAHNLRVVGRLRPGVSVKRAAGDLQAIASRLAERYPSSHREISAGLKPLREWRAGDTKRPLLILLGSVGLVLLIACANIANLQLARGFTRSREVSVRIALGAPRRRILAQLLTENVMLSLLGGFAGFLLGSQAIQVIRALYPEESSPVATVQTGLPVLLFVLATSLVAALLFGLVPALQTSKAGEDALIRRSGRAPRSWRLQTVLLVSEVALALILVIGAGLLIRSFNLLTSVDPGFRTENVLTTELSLPFSRYDRAHIPSFYREFLARVRLIPGVENVALVDGLPLTEIQWMGSLQSEGHAETGDATQFHHRVVSPEYFRALKVPLRKGRFFSETDAPGVVLVNQTLARTYFRAEDPVGRRVRFQRQGTEDSGWLTVVGVVGDERIENLHTKPYPEVFEPYFQNPERVMKILVQTRLQPRDLWKALETSLWSLDPGLPIPEPRPLAQIASQSVARERFLTTLATSFAVIAFALAVIGIFGTTSFLVAQRTREISTRVALGAPPSQVLRWVLSAAMTPVLLGIALGLGGALAVSRVLESLLFGIGARDVFTFAGVSLFLATAALIACSWPAFQAARLDPMVSLRRE
jgi:putative ABC transport system permease protein